MNGEIIKLYADSEVSKLEAIYLCVYLQNLFFAKTSNFVKQRIELRLKGSRLPAAALRLNILD